LNDSETTQSPEVIAIGAGPAGLSAAYELTKLGKLSTILEADPRYVGGISRTVEHQGYRFDIGGHRFFSKNAEVEALWTEILAGDMIEVPRSSRILYGGKYYDYPLKATNAFFNLGPIETFRCLASYLWSTLFPIKPVRSFEDWVSNQFGKRLFSIFFKTYTEKVWGMPCSEISADWAAQRIKGLSMFKAVMGALGIKQGKTIKTLIDNFRYPRLGPGQMWETLAKDLERLGCPLHLGSAVEKIRYDQGLYTVVCTNKAEYQGKYLISSMPLPAMVHSLQPPAPPEVLQAATGLKHRDFITVVLFVRKPNLFPDNWIYIHEPGVKVGRIQNFGNWSQALLADPDTSSLGLEYFCFEGDGLWTSKDEDLIELAKQELEQLKIVSASLVFGGTVVRMAKAYPVLDDDYSQRVDVIRAYLDKEHPNLQVVGRNGMHKYNNQDHAMWSGILAARNVVGPESYNLWNINSDAEYHEEATEPVEDSRLVPKKL
jgi:protoporphyrinogen oxidase